MDRRDILKAVAALPLAATATAQSNRMPSRKITKPKRLAAGDAVAVIAPSSGVSKQAFDRALENIRILGFVPKEGKHARGSKGFLSGTDDERLQDLHWAFRDAEIKGIWCVRGGSGSPRLLPDLDYQLIKKNPKVFIGFSDITALHLAIFQKTGLVTFHGPVGTSEYSEYTKKHVLNMLVTPSAPYKVDVSEFNLQPASELFRPTIVSPGRCRGPLTGGNLSLIGALAGTPFALKDVRGRLLFLEDINEPPYKVDRLLTQLRQSVDLKTVAGIALGVFASGEPTRDAPSASLLSVFQDRLGDLGVPVVYGLSFGHIRDNFTLPMGIVAELDAEKATLTFLETAVK